MRWNEMSNKHLNFVKKSNLFIHKVNLRLIIYSNISVYQQMRQQHFLGIIINCGRHFTFLKLFPLGNKKFSKFNTNNSKCRPTKVGRVAVICGGNKAEVCQFSNSITTPEHGPPKSRKKPVRICNNPLIINRTWAVSSSLLWVFFSADAHKALQKLLFRNHSVIRLVFGSVPLDRQVLYVNPQINIHRFHLISQLVECL